MEPELNLGRHNNPRLDQGISASLQSHGAAGWLTPSLEQEPYFGSRGRSTTTISMGFELANSNLLQPFVDACRILIDRHDALRMRVRDTPPAVRFLAPDQVKTEDWLFIVFGRPSVSATLEELIRCPLDFDGSIFRVDVIEKPESGFLCLVRVHHVASDGISMDVLARELKLLFRALAQGKSAVLPPLTTSLSEYVQSQQSLDDGLSDTQVEYWRKQLTGAVPSLLTENTAEFSPLVGGNHAFGGESAATSPLDERGIRGLTEFARSLRVPVGILIHSAVAIALARATGSHDVLFLTLCGGREASNLQEVVGPFASRGIYIRAKVNSEKTLAELSAEMFRTWLGGIDHSQPPYSARRCRRMLSGLVDFSNRAGEVVCNFRSDSQTSHHAAPIGDDTFALTDITLPDSPPSTEPSIGMGYLRLGMFLDRPGGITGDFDSSDPCARGYLVFMASLRSVMNVLGSARSTTALGDFKV